MRINLLVVKVLCYEKHIDSPVRVRLLILLCLPFFDKTANCYLRLECVEQVDWDTILKLIVKNLLSLL